MTRYVIANTTTLEIERTVECADDQAAAQVGVGEVAFVASGATIPSNATAYLGAGGSAIVAYTAPQKAAKAARPDYDADWSNVLMAWVDSRALLQAKNDQRAIIRLARESAESAGFSWDGSTFYSDPRSETRIIGSVVLAIIASMASQPFSIDWTLSDDSVRTLDGADMIAVGVALGAHVDSIFTAERAQWVSIDAASTVDEVKAVAWVGPP